MTSADLGSVALRWGEADPVVVVCFCAAWCDTCTQFRGAYDMIAAERPDMMFVWLDIEDDHALAGDIDIENFPTLAVYRGDTLLHFGVSLPHRLTVARLIDELARHGKEALDAPHAVRILPHALRSGTK